MTKNIQTHNAKVELVKKFLNYANIADASYAMLHYVYDNNIFFDKWKEADNTTLGDKLKIDEDIQDKDICNHNY